MESTYLSDVAEPAAPAASATDRPDTGPAPVPALILLDTAGDAATCDVDGTCL
jgi:hypothetical protein